MCVTIMAVIQAKLSHWGTAAKLVEHGPCVWKISNMVASGVKPISYQIDSCPFLPWCSVLIGCIYIYICLYFNMCVHMCAVCVHTYMYTHIHTYIHAYIRELVFYFKLA